MNGKLKKVTCFLMAVSLCLGNANVSLAEEQSLKVLQEQGQLSDKYCISVGDDGLLKSESGEYAILEEGEYIVPAGKMEINLRQKSQVNKAMESAALPQEVKDAIIEKAEKGAEYIEIYSPDLLATTKDSTKTNYFTKDGYEMKSVIMVSSNLSTGFKDVFKGIDTKQGAKEMVSIALTVAGAALKNKTYDLLTTGLDLFTNFLNICNLLPGQVATSKSDYVQINLDYNDTDKFTYAKISTTWRLGLITKKVKVTNTRTCTYLRSSGRNSVLTSNKNEKAQVSKNFKKPGAEALKNAKKNMPVTERLGYRTGGSTFYF